MLDVCAVGYDGRGAVHTAQCRLLVDGCRELFRLISCVETAVKTRCGQTASRLVEVLVRASVQLSPLCTADMTPQTAVTAAMVTHRCLIPRLHDTTGCQTGSAWFRAAN